VRFWLAIACASASLALGACNTDNLPPPGQFTMMSGVISDRATNQPIAGAVVIVDTVLTATTDASGKFTIAKVPAGTLDYTIKATGYAIVSSTTTATPGQPFTLDVALQKS
jgi:hypothetical protein